jgi:hypothetical protein
MFLFLMDFEESILVQGSQPYCSVGLQVGSALFFPRPNSHCDQTITTVGNKGTNALAHP